VAPGLRKVMPFCVCAVYSTIYKGYIFKNRKALLNHRVCEKFNLSKYRIFTSWSLPQVDEQFTRRMTGDSDLHHYYKRSSCMTYIDNVTVPIVFITSLDDPAVLTEYVQPIRDFTDAHSKAMLVVTSHGGHCAYYQGGVLVPNSESWIDTVIVELTRALVGNL
jgi:predicted alpha/beta-fold hydrolase